MQSSQNSTSITIRKHRILEAYDEAINWLYDQKGKIESAKYGRNRQSLEEGLRQQETRATEIQDYQNQLDLAINRTFDNEKKEKLQAVYDDLKDVSNKKINCLKTMLEITSLEEHCARLSRQMDLTSVGLVQPSTRGEVGQTAGANLQGFISPSSQDCVFGVQDNWDWIVKLVKCIDIHLKNGSNYHQFFHELDESAPWLEQDLERIQTSFDALPLSGEYSDAQRLTKELEDVMTCLKQWEAKTDRLWEKASKVVPVHLRTDGVTCSTAATALCHYKTTEIQIREGEDVLLLDNSQPNMWKVRNCRGDEGYVPALTVLIPGPYKEAVDAAVKLRLQLLANWTNAIKRLGKRLLCFMLLVFKPDYDIDQIESIRSIPQLDKQDLLRILDHVEDTLKHHWSDHEGFINLQERILALRMILEEIGDGTVLDEKSYSSLVVQITSLDKLMNKYEELWNNWEMYKTSLEASQNPDLMLIVDKWQQLQFVSRDFFSKFWKNELPLDTVERSLMTLKTMTLQGDMLEDVHDGPTEETVSMDSGWDETKVHETRYISEKELNRAKKVDLHDALGTDAITYDTGFDETKTVEETISTETQRPVHRARMINIQDALGAETVREDSGWEETRTVESQIQGERGLSRSKIVDVQKALGGSMSEGFDSDQGRFRTLSNTSTGSSGGGFDESKIVTARIFTAQLSDGGTLVEGQEVFEEGMTEEGVVSTDTTLYGHQAAQSETEGSDFALAHTTRTAETEQVQSAEVEEKKTFVIKSVTNLVNDTEISLQDAILHGIIKPDEGIYIDSRTGEPIPIPSAMTKGLIKVEFMTVRRGQEKKSSIGIITVKTIKEGIRPYIIKSVCDLSTGEKITQQEAIRRNILNEQRGIYFNRTTGDRMLMSDAIDKGFLDVDYMGEAPPPEIVSKTYAVRAVVDRRWKRVVTFAEAVRRGIIDKESGAFKDTLTGDKMYVGDAIMRGFLKARKIDRAHSLNVEPENKMLIDKTEVIRKKVLQPLKVITAFKRAAMLGAMARSKDTNNN